MRICEDLRQAVLQAAIQGKLTKQLSTDSSVDDLLESIKTKKEELIKEKKIRKDKTHSLISDDEIPFEIPNTWKWVRMNEVIDVRDGTHDTPKYVSEGFPLITGKDFYNGYFTFEKTQFISESDYLQISQRSKVEPYDILFSMIGGNIGSMIMVTPENYFDMAIKNVALFKQYIYNDITPKYLFYFLKAEVPRIKASAKGGAQMFVSLKMLRDYPFPVPSIDEQKRIVELLDEFMTKINALEKTETLLEKIKSAFPADMKASILQAAMQGKLTKQLTTDSCCEVLSSTEALYDIPDNWQWSTLKSVANIFTGNSISEAIKKAKYMNVDNGYSYIATKDVGFDHVVEYENGVKIPFEEPKFKKAVAGSILLCIEGGSAGNKIAQLDRDVCFGNKLCSFKGVSVDDKYLYYWLQSPLFLQEFKNNMTGIIGGISQKKLAAIAIPVPPIEEQYRIVERIESLLPLCENLKE